MAKREQMTEQQVAELVVAYLEAIGADVCQEVEVCGGVADIVARVRAEIWIVEVKTSLSLALIQQAMERRRLAHRVYIAAPFSRRTNTEVLAELGIGVFEVRPALAYTDSGNGFGRGAVRELVQSRRWNSRPVSLANELRPEHKTHAKAGAIGAGGRWTEFRATCEALAAVVRGNPGVTLKAAIEQLKHNHYRSNRSAISALAHWVDRGKVPGVELRRSHGTHGAIELHPTEALSPR